MPIAAALIITAHDPAGRRHGDCGGAAAVVYAIILLLLPGSGSLDGQGRVHRV